MRSVSAMFQLFVKLSATIFQSSSLATSGTGNLIYQGLFFKKGQGTTFLRQKDNIFNFKGTLLLQSRRQWAVSLPLL